MTPAKVKEEHDKNEEIPDLRERSSERISKEDALEVISYAVPNGKTAQTDLYALLGLRGIVRG